MVEVVNVDREKGVTELHIEGGCPLCDGELQIRRSPGAVSSYCAQCVWISKATVSVDRGGVHVMHRAMAA